MGDRNERNEHALSDRVASVATSSTMVTERRGNKLLRLPHDDPLDLSVRALPLLWREAQRRRYAVVAAAWLAHVLGSRWLPYHMGRRVGYGCVDIGRTCSWRLRYFWSCVGTHGMTECTKRRYATEASAHRKLTELRRRRRSQRAVKVEDHAFHCPHCRAWHLSSDPLDKRLLTR